MDRRLGPVFVVLSRSSDTTNVYVGHVHRRACDPLRDALPAVVSSITLAYEAVAHST
jgi:hypothetical protein